MKSLIPLLCSTSFLIFASGCRSYIVYVDPEPIHEPVDADQDGFFDHEDCDDANALIFPDAEEVADGLDNNCDGLIDAITVEDLYEGDVLITELMISPGVVSDAQGEWLEIYNNMEVDLYLERLYINNTTTSVELSTSDLLYAGSYYVLGPNTDLTTNGSVSIQYEIDGSFQLDNSNDSVSLTVDTMIIDSVSYDASWPFEVGASLNLDESSYDSVLNDSVDNWCMSANDFGSGDLGSPGMENESCNVLPSGLSLNHNDNDRNVYVSWTAGVRNGGAGGCVLQYNKNGTWTDIAGAPDNCDVDVDTSFALPTSGWIAPDWSGVSIRLLRVSDSLVVEEFSTTLNCSVTLGSSVSTPDIDEDCDADWDNSITNS